MTQVHRIKPIYTSIAAPGAGKREALLPQIRAVIDAGKSTNKTLKISPPHSTELFSRPELEELESRISANADKWLVDNFPSSRIVSPRQPKSTRGRKPNVIHNPFYSLIGHWTYWGRYPVFALDIIEGVARLDWHDRPIGVGGKSMPLAVRNLAFILENLPVVSNEAVEDLLQLSERHARRYVKAIGIIIPRMMENRPQSLKDEMNGVEPERSACEWLDQDELSIPGLNELEKLHHDLRTLTQYNTAEKYEEDYEAELGYFNTGANIIYFPVREQHPKKAQATRMLLDGASYKAVQRETAVDRKTLRKWRAEALAAQEWAHAA